MTNSSTAGQCGGLHARTRAGGVTSRRAKTRSRGTAPLATDWRAACAIGWEGRRIGRPERSSWHLDPIVEREPSNLRARDLRSVAGNELSPSSRNVCYLNSRFGLGLGLGPDHSESGFLGKNRRPIGISTASNGAIRATSVSSKEPVSTQRPSSSENASSVRASGSTIQ